MQTLREEKGPPLPLSSLRLFIPPLRLVCAALWQVVERRDIMDYGLLEEFATSVLEIVPELMTYRERVQLIMGLRARLVLELCRCDDELCRPDTVQPHLNRIRSCVSNQKGEVSDPKVEASEASFMKLIETLLEQPEERELFFQNVFPEEYGPKYDSTLQILVWEFLSRLEKLIPAPNLKQTASWLSLAPALLEECVQSVAHPEPLQALLHHHKNGHHLDTNALRSTGGDYILSSLSFPSSVKEEIASCQAGPERQSYPTIKGYQTPFPSDQPEMSWDCRKADRKVWTVKPPARSASVEVEVKTIEDATEITVKRKTINKEMIKETRRDKAVLCPQTRSGLKTSRLTASCLRRQPVLRLNRLDIGNMPLPKSLLTLILRRGRLQAETRRPGPKGIDRKKKRRRGRGITNKKIETHTLDISVMPLPKSPLTLTLKRGVLLDDPTSSQVQKKRGRKKGAKIGPGITRLKIEKIGAHTLDISNVPLPKPSLKLVIRRGKLQAEATSSQGKKTRGRKKKWRRRCGVKNEGVKRERSPETEEDAEPSDNKLWTTVCDSGGVSESVPQDSLTPEPSNTSHKRSQRVKACSFCRKTFTETLGLTRHMRSHIEQRSYQCTLCGQDFEFSEDLEEHQKSSCEKKSGDDYCGETVQQKKYQKKNPDLKRDKMPDLKGDKKTHLNRANKTNLKRDKKSDLKGHTKDGSIKCHVCGKVTTRIVSLQRHLLLHFNNGAYKCPVCPKTFILNCDLRSHLRLKRSCGKKCSDKVITTRLHLKSNPGDYKCPYCGDTFQLPRDLKGHTKDCSKKCHVCGKISSRMLEMRRHMLKHKNNGPIKCPVCPKTFLYHTDLKKHLKTKKLCREKCSDVMVKDNADLKLPRRLKRSYRKTFSDDVITTKNHLKSNPGDYKCPYCGDTFQLPRDLKGHTKDCSRKCHVCGKTTSTARGMRRHMLRHNNNGAYKCPVCPRTFIYHPDLKKHLKLKKRCRAKCSDVMMKEILSSGDGRCRKMFNETAVMTNSQQPSSSNTGGPLKRIEELSHDSQQSDNSMSSDMNLNSLNEDHSDKISQYQPIKDVDLSSLHEDFIKEISQYQPIKDVDQSNPGEYKCPYCGDTFQLPEDLKRHTKDCSRKCHVCGKISSKACDMRRHMLKHDNNGPIKCPVCPKTFIFHTDLKTHLKTKKLCREKCSDVMAKELLSSVDGRCRKNVNETGVMTSCDQPSSSNTGGPSKSGTVLGLKSFEEFFEELSNDSDISMNSDVNLNSLDEDYSQEISQYQPIKDVDLNSLDEDYSQEISQYQPIKDVDLNSLYEDYSQEISQYQPIKDVDQSNPGKYNCPYCGKTFQLLYDLKGHKKDCSRKCHVCGKTTSTACGMRRHMLKHYNGPIKCPVCPTTFVYHTDLKKHLKTKKICREKCSGVMAKELLSSVDNRCTKNLNETGVMASCEQPSSSNTGGPSNSIEEFSHDLQKSDNSMSSDVNLNSLHEDNSQEISQYQAIKDIDQSNPGEYKCPYCGDTFQLPDDLKGHTKDCSRKCHVCGKISSKACDMRRHMLKHYNNGPIKCLVCPKTFIFHTDLKTHLKTKKLCREKCSDVMAKELLSSVDGRCRKNVNETGVMTRLQQPSSSNTGGPSKSGPVLGLKSFEEFFEELSNHSDISMSSDVNLNSLHEDYSQEISQYQPMKDVDLSILHEDYSQEISQYHPMKDTDLNSLHEDYSQEISHYQPMKDVDLNSLHEVYSDDISQYQPVKDIDPKEDRKFVNDSGVNEMPNDKEPNSTNCPRPLQDSI
uniref:Uncharacterized LOC115157351 n=1 Tax=Salmo trutta TaxID=8032 RepID=A0A673XTE3_SALTR